MMAAFTWIARLLGSTEESMAMPCAVNVEPVAAAAVAEVRREIALNQNLLAAD